MLVTAAKLIRAGIATVGLGGIGVGIGSVFRSLLVAFSRNPSLEGKLFRFAIIGFALTEAMGLFVLMMAFLILFTFLYWLNFFCEYSVVVNTLVFQTEVMGSIPITRFYKLLGDH